jgi:hypothetical protein
MGEPPDDLWEWADQQEENLDRVYSKLGLSILAYHLRELACDFAPDSPSRILRELRLRGWVNYEVTNRRQSAYRVTSVR